MAKRIVLLGNSIAGIKALETLKAAEADCELTVFATEKFFPYRPEFLGEFIARRVTEDKLYYRPQAFYKDLGVEFLFDKNLERVNLKKSVLVTEGKETIPFDRLILAEPPSWKFPDIKGSNKSGIFTPYRLSDLKNILEVLPISETIVIEASSVESVQWACALKERGKEAVLVFDSAYLLPEILDQESSELVMQYLEEFGIRIFKENTIVEILGEGEVKAVRLRTKKVLSCELLIFGKVRPDLRFLPDLELGDLTVGEGFQTPLASVWTVGPLAMRGRIAGKLATPVWNRTPLLEFQGETAAASMLGREYTAGAPVAETDFMLPERSISILGETGAGDDRREFIRFEATPQGPVYKKIFVQNDMLTGAVLINADAVKEKILRFIKERSPLDADPQQLLKSEGAAESVATPTAVDPR